MLPSAEPALPESQSNKNMKADAMVQPWIQSTRAGFFFGVCIALNALLVGFETDLRNASNDGHYGWFIADSVFNLVFLVEVLLRIYASWQTWLKDWWNVFDVFLVLAGVLDTWVLSFTKSFDVDLGALTTLRVLRLMRLLRLLRVFQFCKELMLIIKGLLNAMRAMFWGVLLLLITIFMSSILITRFVRGSGLEEDSHMKDGFYDERFGSLFRTSFTLFQFTMEFQGDVCLRALQDGVALTLFLIVYTCFTNITLLNIIMSIIVDTILSISKGMSDTEIERVTAIEEQSRMDDLKLGFSGTDADSDGDLSFAELLKQDALFSRPCNVQCRNENA